jgi:superfamily II DNA helicase RecQ
MLDGREPDDVVETQQRIADARRSVRDGKGAASDRKHPARDLDDADAPLYEALVEWRRKISKASGAPAYVVFHDATLVAVAEARPTSRHQLLGVAGIGPVKVERYGDEVLALVAAHAGGR